MAHLFAQSGISFGIAHCNFRLRGKEAEQDQSFVRQLAAELNVPFFTVDFDTRAYAERQHVSIQMAARTLRYQWFEEIRSMHEYDKIAIAQHQTDVTETILLNMVRGTGIAGLHGILPIRDKVIRPLLFLNEQTIADIIQQHKIAYREDQSNASLYYKRNLLRHKVLPLLRTLNPDVDQTFSNNAAHIRALEPLLNEAIETLREKLIKKSDYGIHLSKKGLEAYTDPHILYEILAPYNFTIEVLQDLLNQSHIPGKRFDSETHTIYVDRDAYYIIENRQLSKAKVSIEQLPCQVRFQGKTYQFRLSEDLQINPGGKQVKLDADGLQFPLQLRSWEQGDKFQPLGMKGRKKISDLYTQHKIPEPYKDCIPVLVNGDLAILSAGLLQINDAYKISGNTKKVLIFELL